jgi:hypothetical protein
VRRLNLCANRSARIDFPRGGGAAHAVARRSGTPAGQRSGLASPCAHTTRNSERSGAQLPRCPGAHHYCGGCYPDPARSNVRAPRDRVRDRRRSAPGRWTGLAGMRQDSVTGSAPRAGYRVEAVAASARTPSLTRCWSRAPSRTSWLARESASRIAPCARSRACRATGSSTRSLDRAARAGTGRTAGKPRLSAGAAGVHRSRAHEHQQGARSLILGGAAPSFTDEKRRGPCRRR